MALTRITKGVIKPNENYDTHNINSTGIVTAVGANFTGDVNVGGVLTYEDVTSIDSVGIITARNGIDCNGDIDVDGHTNLDNVSIAGITTGGGFKTAGTSSDAGATNGFTAGRINIYDNNSHNIFRIGTGPSFAPTIWQTSAMTVTTSSFSVTNTQSTREYININNSTGILKLGYGAPTADHGFKLETTGKGIKVGTGITFETNGQSTFSGITTSRGYEVNGYSDGGGNYNYFKAGRLKIYDNGSHIHINGTYSAHLYDHSSVRRILTNNLLIYNTASSRYYIAANNSTGIVDLYYGGLTNHGIKLSTSGIGVTVFGQLDTTDLDVDGHTNLDNVSVAGVSTLSGNAYFTGNFIELNNGADSMYSLNRGVTQLFSIRNNATSGVHINTQNSALLCFGVSTGTNNGSVESTLSINSSGNVGIDNQLASEKLHLADSKKLALGDSADLKIYHDGSHSYIDESGTGNLYIQSTHVNIDSKNGEQFINCIQDGAVEIFHDNVKKIETSASGLNVYGSSTAGGVYLKTSGGTNIGWVYANNSGQYFLQHANNHIILKSVQGSAVELYHNNVKKLETSADGIILTSTDAGSSAGPEITLFRDSSSPADADYLGQIKFQGRDDNGTTEPYAKITGKILDASAGGEDGILEFMLRKNSTNNIAARFRSDSLQLINGTNFTVAGTSEFSNLATFTKSGSALRLNDGSILRLGNADADFFIYHDGSSTDYISAGAGKQLRLTTDDFIIKGANNTETLMSAAKDGGVLLYHNNIVRAETTANGFQITNGTLDFANNSGSGASLRNYSAGVFFMGNAAQGDLALYCQDNTNNSIILQANTGEKYIECNMGGSVDLWYHGGLVAKTTQRGLRLISNLASSGGMANMLQLDNTGNNTGDGSKITFARAGTIRSEIESIKNETANNETDIVFRNTNAGSLYERLRIFGDGSITQNYANPNASAVFRISKSGGGAAELRFDTATVNTSNLYLGSDEQLRIRYGSTEHTRFTSDGFVGIGQENPKAGLSIRTLGDYSTNDGNTYWIPEGQWSTVWNHANDILSNRDYWVGFAGGYHQSGNSVNISLAPNRGNLNAQQGMYISGEATGNSSSDIAVGKILGGSATGISTLASTGKRATKSELLRIRNNGNVGINTSTVDTKLHIVHSSAGEDVVKIEAKPVTASTGAKSKLIFQITQSNNQSARLAEIHSLAEGGWGGGLAINVKPSNGVPQNTTEEALRINSSDSAATNLRMVVDAYLQLGGYNNTDESFVNLATLFSARDMAGSSLVSGQTDTISGYARRRITSDGSGTFFFGPYGAFPAGDYTALFRLKVADRSGSSTIGYIDVIGNGVGIQGRNTAPRTGTGQSVNMYLQTNDFTASNTYQYFALDFSKSNSAAHIETRFLSYATHTDVYLDHVLILPRINHGVEGVTGMFDY